MNVPSEVIERLQVARPTDQDAMWIIDFVARQIVRLERAYPDIPTISPDFPLERGPRAERASYLRLKLRHMSDD